MGKGVGRRTEAGRRPNFAKLHGQARKTCHKRIEEEEERGGGGGGAHKESLDAQTLGNRNRDLKDPGFRLDKPDVGVGVPSDSRRRATSDDETCDCMIRLE